MITSFRECLWRNFGASIDMLSNAIEACPNELWHQGSRFFYLAYHTTIFLDYYLTQPVRSFQPTLPYTITDEAQLPAEAVDDVLPKRLFSRQEILDYLAAIRLKCKQIITLSSEEELLGKWIRTEEVDLHDLCPSMVVDYTALEILFYNFRHVQHHAAQLNMLLRLHTAAAPGWVASAK